MNKGLEALKELRKYGNATVNYCSYLNEQCDIVEKELKEKEELEKDLKQVMSDYQELGSRCEKEFKALEIIKEKRVDIGWLIRSKNCSKYNLGVGESQALKKEEYDLLKEVLR